METYLENDNKSDKQQKKLIMDVSSLPAKAI